MPTISTLAETLMMHLFLDEDYELTDNIDAIWTNPDEVDALPTFGGPIMAGDFIRHSFDAITWYVLQALVDNPGDPGGFPAHWEEIWERNTLGWDRVGTDMNPFTGSFNGNNYAIFNLFLNRPLVDQNGFWGVISGATIQNVGFLSPFVRGGTFVGCIVGDSVGGDINNCYVSNADIVGDLASSGICGRTTGEISNSSLRSGSVVGEGSTGGVCSILGATGIISQSYSDANISGSTFVGGVCGGSGGEIYRCYSRGIIEGTGIVGGAVGANANLVIDSYSHANIMVANTAGGFVGYNSGGLFDCYSKGLVNAITDAFGFCGEVALDPTYLVLRCHWDTQTSGHNDDATAEAQPKTTSQMLSQSNYVDWDFDTVWSMSTPDSDFEGYPVLQWQDLPTPGRIVITEGSTTTVEESGEFVYTGACGTSATIIINGKPYTISNNPDCRFVWDDGGYFQHTFDTQAVLIGYSTIFHDGDDRIQVLWQGGNHNFDIRFLPNAPRNVLRNLANLNKCRLKITGSYTDNPQSPVSMWFDRFYDSRLEEIERRSFVIQRPLVFRGEVTLRFDCDYPLNVYDAGFDFTGSRNNIVGNRANIYYTLNGKDPTYGAKVYSGPITIRYNTVGDNVVLKAQIHYNGQKSPIYEINFTIVDNL